MVSSFRGIAGLLTEALNASAAESGDTPDALDWRARQHAALLAFGRRTSARPPVAVLCQDAVALLVEILQADLGGHSEVLSAERMIARAFQFDASHRPLARGTKELSLDPACSLSGYAMYTAGPVVSVDLAAEERFTDQFLTSLNLVSGLSVPLPVTTSAYGTIDVYSIRPREFSQPDVRFAETIAHLLATAVGRLQVEERLRCEQLSAATVLDTVQSLVILLDEQGRITHLNRMAERTLGFSGERLYQQPFWTTIVPPGERKAFQAALRTLATSDAVQVTAGLQTSEGVTLAVHWNVRAVSGPQGAIQSLVLSGTLPPQQIADQPLPFSPVPTESAANLRTSVRRTFRCDQQIAPVYNGMLPGRNKLFEVHCKDISGGGISFYLENEPDFDSLVVALGKPPTVTYFTAAIVRVGEEVVDGQKLHLVGCRFTGRVHL